MRAFRLAAASLALLGAGWAVDPQAPPPASTLRNELQRILASREYESGSPRPDSRPSLWNWVLDQFGRLLRSMSRLGETAPGVMWAILVLCFGILGAILLHAFWIAARALRASRPAGPRSGAQAGPRRPEAAELLEEARREAELGRFTPAIRLCHRAALLALDRRGLVRFQESLTSTDYARQLVSQPPERAWFQALTALYEPASFGKAPTTEREYQASRDLVRALQAGAAP